jgi:segregation and condensation protein B
MSKEKIKTVLECLLFVTNRPLPIDELCEITGESKEEVERNLDEIQQDLVASGSALQVARIAEGVQFATREGFGYWVKKLFREQTTFRLSQSAMEILSIIAYKQPLTRAEIEEIRGVEVIGVLETLLERKLVKVAGRKETVGRPLLYATTHEFLRHFNLWKISDLPSLEDLAKEAERKSATENGSAEAPSETAPSGEPQAAEAEPAAEPAPQDSTPVEESSPGEPAV